MAKKQETVKLERSYTIPLRKEIQKAPKYRRAKKAVTAVKEFLKKHMKSEDIKVGPELNMNLWKHGMRNPPHKVTIHAIKEDGVVRAELEGVEYKTIQIKPKTETGAGLKGKLQGMLKGSEEKKDAASSDALESLAGEKKKAQETTNPKEKR